MPSGAAASVPVAPEPTLAPQPAPSLEQQFASMEQALPSAVRQQLLAQPEGETRIVTLLFADMTGSLATTVELHPEDAANLVNRLLKAMVDILLKYEGRIDRFLGDGVLAVFGTPQAHENDPERAIRAALEIREAAQKLGLNVTAGINTGQVYVGEVGSDRHQEQTVMGPVVSVASRLQGKAEPGQIMVGETTYRHTRRAFEFTPLSLDIKGISQPVIAYRVERALPRPEKVRGIEGLRAELIGRDEELARLHEVLEAARQGRGQMVSLIGEAGVGKSRLVAELKAAVRGSADLPVGDAGREPGATSAPLWLEGRCVELGMAASYWLFIDLLREHFGLGAEEDDPTRAGRLTSRLKRLVEAGSLSRERLEEIAPLVGRLLSVRLAQPVPDVRDERFHPAGPAGWGMSADPGQVKRQTFMAVRDYLIALARQQPVVLVFEDLHWADSLSLDLILLLMDALTLAPLLLLCIYRPEREHKCWLLGTHALQKCPERYTEISLRELTPAQSRRLVESLLAIDNLPEPVKELILAKARGNPFFVEEVVRSLVDAGLVYREGEIWRAKEGIEAIQVPETVQSVILSRVDRLEQELKRVLEGASVIGRLFRKRVLEHILREQAELERALWQLEERQLIYEERVLPEEEYSFKHVLTQETIYASLLKQRRARFHQRVAEALEALYPDGLEEYYEQLAYHYEGGGDPEKAVDYLLKAGERARDFNADGEAIEHLQAALRLLEGLPEDEAHLKQRWHVAELLSRAYEARLERDQARQVLEEYVVRAERAGYSWGAAAAHLRLGWFLGTWFIGTSEIELARHHGEQSLALCERHGLAGLLPLAAHGVASSLSWGPRSDFPRAEALLRRALEGREGVAPVEVQKLYGSLARICSNQGKWEEAMAALRESLAGGGLHQAGVYGLNHMEEALDAHGRRAEFVAFCEETAPLRSRLVETGAADMLAQWYLAPAQSSREFTRVSFHDDFEAPELRGEWQWHDPLQTGAYSLTERSGCLTLRAAKGAELTPWSNVNAPHLFLELRGDFALEVRMEGDWDEREEAGGSGLLVWKDFWNYLRLEKSCMAPWLRGSVMLMARIEGEFRFLGRGLLRGNVLHLRLEREGERFTTLCSADGASWLTCGQVDFPAHDPLLVGVASTRGVVAHFDWVRVLTKG